MPGDGPVSATESTCIFLTHLSGPVLVVMPCVGGAGIHAPHENSADRAVRDNVIVSQ